MTAPAPLPLTHRLARRWAENGGRGSRWAWEVARRVQRRPASAWLRLPDGALLPGNQSDYMARHLYRGGYEFGERHIARALIRPGGTVVDVGANLGTYTHLAVELGAAHVIALEPGPAFEDLTTIADTLGWRTVRILRVAASDDAGSEVLHVPAGQAGLASIRPVAERTDPRTVTTQRLDTIELPGGDVALLKIDVEGAEAAVLEGADGWLRARRVRALLVEVSPEFGPTAYIHDIAREFDFAAYVVEYRRAALRFVPQLSPLGSTTLARQANVVLVRPDVEPVIRPFVR